MKKTSVRLLILAFMIFILAGCGKSSKPVTAFCKALQKLDYEGMCGTFDEEMMTPEEFGYMMDIFADMGLEDIYTEHAKNIKYTVGKPVVDEADENCASVSVNISYDDYSAGIKLALDTYYKEYYEDEEGLVDETRLTELLRECYMNDTPARREETVVFYTEKTEKDWVVAYDYDMIERVVNAITCNLMDAWYDYEYDFGDVEGSGMEDDQAYSGSDFSGHWYDYMTDEEIDGILADNGIERTEDTDLSEYEEFFEEYVDDDWGEDWEEEVIEEEDWEEEDSEEALYDEIMDRLFSVESSGMFLIKNYHLNEVDEDDEYYILTGDVYDYDLYFEWLSIVNSEDNFAENHPYIYEDMDNGLYCEEMDVYIPKDLAVSGLWPTSAGESSYNDILSLISSGHDMVYTGDMDDEASELYDSCTNY